MNWQLEICKWLDRYGEPATAQQIQAGLNVRFDIEINLMHCVGHAYVLPIVNTSTYEITRYGREYIAHCNRRVASCG